MKKRSASTMLRAEFDRLANKHHARTDEEYEQWISQQILNESSYLSMLRSHLYMRKTEKKEPLKAFEEELYNKLISFINESTDQNIKHNLKSFLVFSGYTSASAATRVQNYVRYLVAQRAYLRLISMNDAYMRLQTYVKEQSVLNADELNNQIKNTIWSILKGSKNEETVISYIKVISREHLSTYYHIRRAAVEVLIDLLKAFITNDLQSDHPATHIKNLFEHSLFNPKKYQFVMTIIQRLAMLQSSMVVDPETMRSTISFLEKEREQYKQMRDNKLKSNPEIQLLRMPRTEQFIKQLTKSLKITTMLNSDDVLCNRLWKLSHELERGDD